MRSRVLLEKEYGDQYWRNLPLSHRVNTVYYPAERVNELLKHHLPVSPDYRFLEVGCGSGQWMIYCHEMFGYQVFGSDYSSVAYECGRKNLATKGVHGQIWEDDLLDIKLPVDSFDVILNAGFIEHFSDPIEPLAVMESLLAPAGTIVTWAPNLAGVYGPLLRLTDKSLFQAHEVLDQEEMRRIHEDVGLQVLTSQYVGGFNSYVVKFGKHNHGLLLGLLRRFQGLLDHSVWLCMRLLQLHWESRLFSPIVIVIARKPDQSSRL